MTTGPDLRQSRARMVERQLARRGIHDGRVLDAMRMVPRDLFVPAGLRARAYDDCALDIAAGQTISQPYIVALMLQLAGITAGERVLEVGTGSGYSAAVMAHLARQVISIERHRRLVVAAHGTLARAGIANVDVILGDGTLGLPREAPFDVIVVTAGGDLPGALKAQLSIGGRLVIPLGSEGQQRLVRLTRRSETDYQRDDFGAVAFVPLVANAAPVKG